MIVRRLRRWARRAVNACRALAVFWLTPLLVALDALEGLLTTLGFTPDRAALAVQFCCLATLATCLAMMSWTWWHTHLASPELPDRIRIVHIRVSYSFAGCLLESLRCLGVLTLLSMVALHRALSTAIAVVMAWPTFTFTWAILCLVCSLLGLEVDWDGS